MLKIILLLASFLFVSIAYASELSKQYASCMDKSEGITSNMLACQSDEVKRQDARLNTAYKQLMSKLAEEPKKELRDAQRLWIKYRDANCNFYDEQGQGGTSATLNASGCFLEATEQRAGELEWFIGRML